MERGLHSHWVGADATIAGAKITHPLAPDCDLLGEVSPALNGHTSLAILISRHPEETLWETTAQNSKYSAFQWEKCMCSSVMRMTSAPLLTLLLVEPYALRTNCLRPQALESRATRHNKSVHAQCSHCTLMPYGLWPPPAQRLGSTCRMAHQPPDHRPQGWCQTQHLQLPGMRQLQVEVHTTAHTAGQR